MTRVSADPIASLPIQPPRSKSARDDAAPPRDDFSAMVDDNRPDPAEPARGNTADKTDRPRPADDRRDNVAQTSSDKTPAEGNKPADETETSATAMADTPAAVSLDVAKPDLAKPDIAKSDLAKSDGLTADVVPVATAEPKTDAAPTTVPNPVIAVAPAVPIPTVAPIVVQAPVIPAAAPQSAPVTQAGPLSIAAAALAATAATVQATTPQKAVVTSDTKTATEIGTTTATTAPLAAIGATATPLPEIAEKTATPALAAPQTAGAPTSDTSATEPENPAAMPAAPLPSQTASAKPEATSTAATPTDAAPADRPAAPTAKEHHITAVQPDGADIAAPNFIPAQPAPPTATTIATAVPQISVVASQTAPMPLHGLAMQIATTAISGKTSFDIRLDPAELGRIDVRLDVDRHGNVTSHLTVEKPETLAMLRQDAPQLQRALNEAGLQTSDKGLQFSLSDQSLSGQNNNSNGHADDNRRPMQRLVIADDAMPIASAGRSYGRMLASSSGVDIRI